MFHTSARAIVFYLSLTIAAALMHQACGGSSQVGAERLPTSTPPRPTPSLATAANTPGSTPTSVMAQQLQLSPYTHPSGRFSVSHPASWEPFERADGVIFVEPGDNAGYSVVFSDVGKSYDEQELNQYLVTFVGQNFAGEDSGFKVLNQEQMVDGSVVAQFASNDPNLGRAISEIRVFQNDTIVFVLHFSATADQWDSSRNGLAALVDSFRALDTSSAASAEVPASEPEPPLWELIGPENEAFGFFYADNWEVTERDGNSVSVREPNLNMVFSASSSTWPKAANTSKAAEEAALKHVESLFQQFEQVQQLPPAEFPLDTSSGTTIDFTYRSSDGTLVAGSVVTAVHDGRMYKIVFTAPAEPAKLYDLALQWFNPMLSSFKFLSPGASVYEEP